jgi:hypothetical protein
MFKTNSRGWSLISPHAKLISVDSSGQLATAPSHRASSIAPAFASCSTYGLIHPPSVCINGVIPKWYHPELWYAVKVRYTSVILPFEDIAFTPY